MYEQRSIKEVLLFLQSHGVTTNLAIKIYKQYEDDALGVVQTKPYKLVQDVRGIGFKTADQIARALGLAHDDPGRIEAGIAYTLNRMADEGHVYVPQEKLIPEAGKILGVAEEKVTAVLDALESEAMIKRETLRWPAEGGVSAGVLRENGVQYSVDGVQSGSVREEQAVYLTPMYFSEIGVMRRVQGLLNHPTSRLAALKQSKIVNLKS